MARGTRLFLLVVVLLAGGGALLRFVGSSARPARTGTVGSGGAADAGERRAELVPAAGLEGDAVERDELEAPPGARAEADSTQAVRPPAGSPLAWLRAVLPERYGALDDAALLALEELDLRGAELTDADLYRLAAFPDLARLSLRGTAITDAGLAALTGLPLTQLDLRGTAVTGNGFALLPVTRLEALHLTDTQVTERDLARLPSLPALTTLKLNFLALSDFTVETLAAQPALRHVELDGTGLTDDGLRRLLALLPGIARVEARNTRVSPEFAHELASARPELQLVLE